MDHTEYINNIKQTVEDAFSALTGDEGIENWDREACKAFIESDWEIGDEDIEDSREQYIEDILNWTERKLQTRAAAAMLGSIRTSRKAASSRENGKLGGRPRKTLTD